MKDGSIVLTAFTRAGAELALKLADLLGGKLFVSEKNFVDGAELMTGSLSDWAGEYFNKSQAMIFVCACGIAVRAIAPYIKSKLEDPAVIVIDEKGQFVIPVLSGHVGGANDLARKIASFTHGVPFVTTATDVNNLVAVDEWAVKNDLIIENPKLIKEVSGAVLNHERVGVAITEQNIKTPWPATLFLRPKNLILGAGCKKDFEPEKFEQSALKFLDDAGVSPLSLKAVASINIKANEAALINFAAKYNLEFLTFKAEELMSVPGDFASSQKVLEVTGADNVCERAAALAALRLGNSQNYILMRSKTKFQGVTCALAKIKN
ncbi:MAG: cobalt-precorrin 5A hydrolase [Synergistaceae bacterium]|nr:cobalt-precorrin 5A hydrolase [Synergistaceae bacterium]